MALPNALGVVPLSVSLRNPPLEATLVLTTGVTALYGKNGAGKTRALDALRSLLTGEPAGGWLYVRVGEPTLENDSSHPLLQVFPVANPIQSSDPMTLEQIFGPLWSVEKAAHDALARALTPPFEPTDEWHDEMFREIASQGLLAVRVAFGAEQPTWDVFVAAQIDATTPTLLAERDSLLDDWREWRAARRAGDEKSAESLYIGLAEEPSVLIDLGDPLDPDEPPVSDTAWPPHVFECIGTTTQPFFTVYDESIADPDAATLNALLAIRRPSVLPAGTERPQLLDATGRDLSEEARNLLRGISASANEFLQLVLLDAPKLKIALTLVENWLGNPRPLKWQLLDAPSDEWVDLANGSRAQSRWASFAISAALLDRARSEPHSVMLMDEPEMALHPAAQEHMARGLALLAERIGSPVIVATHSPSVLAQPQNRLMHVHRLRGRGVISELAGVSRDALDDLGLRPTDHLLLQRTVLLVEGIHDLWVIEHFLGNELLRQRVWVIPLHGAVRAASAIDANVLLDFTDARLVVALDKLDAPRVQAMWDDARMSLIGEGVEAAVRVLNAVLSDRKLEEKYLKDLCRKALEDGRSERIEVFGFSRPDILDYLPIELLVPDAHAKGKTWSDLHQEHDSEQADKKQKIGFKKWSDERYDSHLRDDDVVREAVQLSSRDSVDEEFHTLIDFCRVVPPSETEGAPGDA